jgi:predicted DNA-binding protein (MmcQ/YjbR family)
MSVPKLTGFAAELRAFALSLPETTEDFPWGERAFKVKSKAFVFLGVHDGDLSFSVKLPKTGNQALALPFAEPTHYGLGKHGWVTIRPKKKVTKTLQAQIRLDRRELPCRRAGEAGEIARRLSHSSRRSR